MRTLESSAVERPRYESVLVLALAVVAGTAVMVAVDQLWDGPSNVDVVGLPLVLGYSETTELAGLYGFAVTVLGVSIIGAGLRVNRARRRQDGSAETRPAATRAIVGAVVWPWLALAPLFSRDLGTVLLYVAGVLPSFAWGAWRQTVWCGWRDNRQLAAAILGWCSCVAIWLAGSPEFRWLLRALEGTGPLIVVAVVLIPVASSVAHARGRMSSLICRLIIAITAVLLLGGALIIAPERDRTLIALGVLSAWHGQRSVASTTVPEGPAVTRMLMSVQWIGLHILFAIALLFPFWVLGDSQNATLRVLTGMAATSLLSHVLGTPRVRRSEHDDKRRSDESEVPQRPVWKHLPSRLRSAVWTNDGIVVAAAVAVMVHPAMGGPILTAVVASGILSRIVSRRWSAHATRLVCATLLVLGLAVSHLPQPPVAGRQIDAYHDGYVMACLWEFENGKTLYEQVVPVHSFQFYVGLTAHQLFGPTLDAYRVSLRALDVLAVTGAAAIAFVWTRSLSWSLATALAVGMLHHWDARQGMLVCLIAMSLRCLQTSSRCWLIVVPLNAAHFVGLDAFLNVLAPSLAALVSVPPAGKRVTFRTTMASTAQLTVWAVVPFGVIMFLWQGSASVLAFWQVTGEYIRHYGAAIGIPIAWDVPEERYVLVGALLVLAGWVFGGVSTWTRLSASRRRMGVFVTAALFLTLHRAFGRSDIVHVRDTLVLVVCLAGIGLFELTIAIRHMDVNGLRKIRRFTPALLILLASFAKAHDVSSISAWTKRFAALRAKHAATPRSDSRETRRNTASSVWAIERPMWYVDNRRSGPTRHPLAHCATPPNEQRRLLLALRRAKPERILWSTSWSTRRIWADHLPSPRANQANEFVVKTPAGNVILFAGLSPEGAAFPAGLPTADIMLGVDSIATPLRYYQVAEWVFDNYRPVGDELRPRPADWKRLEEIPVDWNGPLHCGDAARAWGEAGRVGVLSHIDAARELNLAVDQSTVRLATAGPIVPSRFNVLSLSMAIESDDIGDSSGSSIRLARLEIVSADEDSMPSRISFWGRGDRQHHEYLVPIGCLPAWSWRQRVAHLTLTVAQARGQVVKARLLRLIDPRDARPGDDLRLGPSWQE